MNSQTTDSTNEHTQNGPPAVADSTLLRGALKIEISTSTPVVFAGTEFSIYVVIRNPFPVAVTIYSTETHIPVALSDENWRKLVKSEAQVARKGLLERIRQTPDQYKHFQLLLRRLEFSVSDLYEWIWPSPGPRVAIAVTPESQKSVPVNSFLESYADMLINTDGGGYVAGNVDVPGGDFIGRDKWDLRFEGVPKEHIRQILWDIDEYRSGRQPAILHPGDSVVVHFILKTTRWITFAPIAHTFQIQVRYEVDGFTHVDTIPFPLSIRAPMASALVGATLGSFLGSLVNQKTSLVNGQTELIQSVLTSMIFAIVIVVAFARKNNVQQVVSVEDFWGGVFIGFLVGYSGEKFIESVLGASG
jgi:hypothetical protein